MQSSSGLLKETIDVITGELEGILANNHVLYAKTRSYHWNIEDARFCMLHELFEKQYLELAEQGDLIAERIRQLGRRSPGTLRRFLEQATLREGQENLSGNQMIDDLAASHEMVIQQLRLVIAEAEQLDDPVTADILIGVCRSHEKSAWVLRSHL